MAAKYSTTKGIFYRFSWRKTGNLAKDVSSYVCLFYRHSEILQTAYDLEGVQDVRTLREFDERFTSKMFGYTNVEDYYKSATPHEKVGDIRTPLLAINAADDAFSPYAGKWVVVLCTVVSTSRRHSGK